MRYMAARRASACGTSSRPKTSLVVRTLNALWEYRQALRQRSDLDMVAAGWEATVDTYLGRATKARILASVPMVNGTHVVDDAGHHRDYFTPMSVLEQTF